MAATSPHTGTPLPPFRFSVRSLLVFVSVCGVFMGLCRWLPTASLGVLVLGMLIVGVHIAGSAIGTRLRDGPEQKTKVKSQLRFSSLVPEEHFAPTTNLRERTSLGWTVPIASAIGALLGMGGGWYSMYVTYGNQFEWIAILVAMFAFGILGAFGAFILATFLHVLWRAVHDSHRGE